MSLVQSIPRQFLLPDVLGKKADLRREQALNLVHIFIVTKNPSLCSSFYFSSVSFQRCEVSGTLSV